MVERRFIAMNADEEESLMKERIEQEWLNNSLRPFVGRTNRTSRTNEPVESMRRDLKSMREIILMESDSSTSNKIESYTMLGLDLNDSHDSNRHSAD